MKKITLLVTLLVTSVAFTQQTIESHLNSGNLNLDLSEISPSVISSNSQTRDIVDTYTTRADFNDACDGTLILEDFAGGPGAIAGCGPEISAAGDICFAAGEIQDGIVVTRDGGADTVYVPAGSFGNASAIVGANTFVNFTIINFPDNNVNSVGMDVYALTTGGVIQVRVFGSGGLMDSFSVTSPTTATFFGVIADEPITSIELEDLTQVNAELVGNVEFGECTALTLNENILSQITVYPSPAKDVINVKSPSNLQINSVILYDLSGKNTGATISNGVINVANLSRGIYMLSVETTAGTLTKKIVKQ